MTILEKINEELKLAIKAKDQLRLNTLRMLKTKILTVDARGNLSDSETIKIFKTYYKNLKEALEQAKELNRPEAAEDLAKELDVIQEFLPKPLSFEETKKIVLQAIEETNAKTKREFGLVMKAAMKLNGQLDGKIVKEIADEILE